MLFHGRTVPYSHYVAVRLLRSSRPTLVDDILLKSGWAHIRIISLGILWEPAKLVELHEISSKSGSISAGYMNPLSVNLNKDTLR